jgi:electron transport complex protein RnfB
MSLCINCDACLRACPPPFGAIFNHGPDVVIVPELCSGCDKCLPACPIPDCIVSDPGWSPAPDDWPADRMTPKRAVEFALRVTAGLAL